MFDFSIFRKTKDAVNDRLSQISGELGRLNQEVSALSSAPANKADLHELVDRWVDRSASSFEPALRQQFLKHNGTGRLIDREIGLVEIARTTDGFDAAGVNAALCWLAGDAVKQALRGAVDRMDWPGEGPKQIDREARMKQVSATIASLSAERSRILEQARESGVDV